MLLSRPFADVALPLRKRGWQSIMADNGKIPTVPAWQVFHESPASDETIEHWRSRYAGFNVGLVCGGIVGIDIDVLDAVKADAIEALAIGQFGATPLKRIGRAPKRALLYRSNGSVRTEHHHSLDILGPKSQIVIFGTHPNTQQPYSWPDKSPLDVSPAELPSISAAQVQAFLEAAMNAGLIAPKDGRSTPRTGRPVKSSGLAEPIRSAETGLVEDHRESHLTRIAAEVCFDAWLGDQPYDLECLADQAWTRFQATTIADRGKWDRSEAAYKVERAIAKFDAGEICAPIPYQVEVSTKRVGTAVGATATDVQAIFARGALRALLVLERHKPGEIEAAKLKVKHLGIWAGVKRAMISLRTEMTMPKEHPYEIVEGCIAVRQSSQNGGGSRKVANFAARITSEELLDDGAEQTLHFRVEGTLANGAALPPVDVPAADFAGMNWAAERWGAGPIIEATQGAVGHSRAAIQHLSGTVLRRTVYTHTGWRRIDGDMTYLHAGGGIGPHGAVESVRVRLGGALASYDLGPAIGVDEATAVRASVGLRDVAPLHVTVPLLAAAYLAPLQELKVGDVSLFLEGETGTGKSELAALVQAHFGREFNARTLPANWASTANALTETAFLAKDAVLVVDDFVAAPSPREQSELKAKAERLLRGAGNRSGRGRLSRDLQLKDARPPRCVIVATGEDAPSGHSVVGRCMVLPVKRGDVRWSKVTIAQTAARQGIFVEAMRGYVRWLAANLNVLRESLHGEFESLRASMSQSLSGHAREPEKAAMLYLAWQTFLRFATESNHISAAERAGLESDGMASILAAANLQVVYQRVEDPVDWSIELLRSAISTGTAYVVDVTHGNAPADARSWGWLDGAGLPPKNADLVGWIDGRGLYLEPNAAYAVVQKMAGRHNKVLPMNQATLWRRLEERGLLGSRLDPGRARTRKVIRGQRQNVIHLRPEIIWGKAEIRLVA